MQDAGDDDREKALIPEARRSTATPAAMEPLGAEPLPPVQHVYDFARLDRRPEGVTSLEVTSNRMLSKLTSETGKISTADAVLTGKHIVCALERRAQGTGLEAQSHTAEQFDYIIRGVMMSDIEGDRVFARPGTILHTPAGVTHSGFACPDEDLLYVSIRDRRLDPPSAADVDSDRPGAFAGFGIRSAEPRQSTSDIVDEALSRPPGPGKRYVYRMLDDADTGRKPATAEVTTDAQLRLPPGIRGKILSGERLHVGVLRFEPGATLNNYRRDNEQIAFVIEGEIEVDFDEDHVTVHQRCVLHVPAGMRHELYAPEGAVVLIAQDNRPAATA